MYTRSFGEEHKKVVFWGYFGDKEKERDIMSPTRSKKNPNRPEIYLLSVSFFYVLSFLLDFFIV